MNTTTGVDIGSLAKQVTAAGIMKLLELGKLKLDDALSAHIAPC